MTIEVVTLVVIVYKMSLQISKIYGFPIVSSRVDYLLDELCKKMESEAEKSGPSLLFTPNPEMVVQASKERDFQAALLKSEYNIADGIGLVILSKISSFFGLIEPSQVIGERITGADLSWLLADRLEENKGKVFLLGAKPRSNIKAQLKLRKSFPNLKVNGEPGYLGIDLDDPEETKRVVDLINKFSPDLLLVAFGQVRQEQWLVKNRSQLKTKLAIGVGGTFDYWSGEKVRAPRILGRIGLEWLWRLCIEPKRLMRIVDAVVVFPVVGFGKILQNRG